MELEVATRTNLRCRRRRYFSRITRVHANYQLRRNAKCGTAFSLITSEPHFAVFRSGHLETNRTPRFESVENSHERNSRSYVSSIILHVAIRRKSTCNVDQHKEKSLRQTIASTCVRTSRPPTIDCSATVERPFNSTDHPPISRLCNESSILR